MPEDVINTGYFRYPTIRDDAVVFVSEDDLWTVDRTGGLARRLTSNLGPVGRVALSPTADLLAFTGTEEHHAEVYVMPSDGGPASRITFLGANSAVRGWTGDGQVIFASDTGQPFAAHMHLYTVSPEGGPHTRVPVGPAHEISIGPDGGSVIGRHTTDPARWKRYRGGTSGDLWVDRSGDGTFRRLVDVDGNIGSPMWIGGRIYFISDHEGIGNLYSCTPTGRSLRRHTDHGDYYARWASTDGRRIVYQHAGEIWVYDPDEDTTAPIEVEFHSPRIGRNRKFVDAAKFAHGFGVHPKGHSITIETRGKLFSMPLWEEAVRQYGQRDGVRYRLPHWTHDGKNVVVVSDEGGEEALEVYSTEDPNERRRLDGVELGRVTELVPSPTSDEVAVTNHRHEVAIVDLQKGSARVVDQSPFARIFHPVWSPDGRWLAYACSETVQTISIKLCEVASGQVHLVTPPNFRDLRPSFDPEGKYLYFLSYRSFDPVSDMLFFDYSFPRAVRPHLVTLQADTPHPFRPRPRGFGEKPGDAKPPSDDEKKEKAKKEGEPPRVDVDIEEIADRVLAFPMPEARYSQVWGIKGKVLFTKFPVSGTLDRQTFDPSDEPKGVLESYDFTKLEPETLAQGISSFRVSQDGATLVYAAGRRLRAIKAGEKADPKTEKERPGRKSGWIDLARIKVSVDPGAEWVQMQREAWRFQRDHFWVPDMSGVDWERIYDRYRPLADKIGTRYEFSDLMWEMLGELGTSHAYDIGGDLRPPPPWPVGHLGCDLELRPRSGRWVITHIVRGDTWDPRRHSPLAAPGVNVREGDAILAVNGQPTDATTSPNSLLVAQANQDVELTIADGRGRNPRTVVVKTLRDETPARYREWVERNRAAVHEATDGRVGYVHIPNMGPLGFSEFHRYYLAELDRDALIVDVRFNGGGHVSQIILEKLARKRIGYDVPRWGKPEPYPSDSPAGPLVCITNERAGSDGDIFTHCFKLMELGPVVGKRTWGGVIGITLRHTLADNGITTQPEFSFWFTDVGWGVENYGTDPTHDVDIAPQDHEAGHDPQMDTAIRLVTQALKRHKPPMPDMSKRPNLALPTLPPRTGQKQPTSTRRTETTSPEERAAERPTKKTTRKKHPSATKKTSSKKTGTNKKTTKTSRRKRR